MDERKRKREKKQKIQKIQDEEQQPMSKIEGRELEESQGFQY
jgi:hypothetical protein